MRGKGREENKLFLLGKKRLLHRLIISYKLDETSFFISLCFIRTHRTWITANASIYKISTWVDIFHFQFSTSISLYYQHTLEQKSGSYLPELPPIQPEVNRGKQRLVATWFTLVALKTENLYLGMQKMNVRFVGQAINRIYAVLLVNSFYKVIIENVFTFKISVLLKMAQMRLFSRREVKQVWERASDIRLRLATRLIKLGISNQGALRWHLNENRDFFLLGSLNYLLSLNRQFEQPSKYVLFM